MPARREILAADDHLAPDGRVMEVLSEHQCQGWLEGYLLTGRHGLFNCYEAFIHIVDSMFNQHAKWLKVTARHPLAAARSPRSTTCCPRTSGGRTTTASPTRTRASSTTSSTRRPRSSASTCRPTRTACSRWPTTACAAAHYVNVIVAGKQPALELPPMDDAVLHCTRGIGIWEWASNDQRGEPDVVMACCGDVPTLETLAAVDLLRQQLPDLKVRVVNVVDLMRLQPETEHPHGLSDAEFDALFTADRPVIFAYHGYPWLIHRLTYRRTNHDNIHVRGYKEEGTTTTPFDMVMLNDLDRFHLVIDVIDRVPEPRRARRRTCASGWSTSGSAAAPTPAAKARTRPRSATGPGRTRRSGALRACASSSSTPGSSSLKLAVLDADGHGRRQRRPAPRRAGAADAGRAARPRSTRARRRRRRRPPDRPRRRRVHERRSVIDDAVRPALARADRPRPAAPAEVAGGARRGPRGAARRAGGRVLRHRLPRHDPRRRRHLRAARTSGASAGRSAATASTACPTPTPRAAPPSCSVGRSQGCGSSPATSAPAPRWPPSTAACSVDTTMGFTPLEGLVMATRSGRVDPGLVLWLEEHVGHAARRARRDARAPVRPARPRRAPRDMRDVLARARRGRRGRARSRSTSTCTGCAPAIAAMAAALGGLDVLVFTGGVGENSPAVRSRPRPGSASSASASTPGATPPAPVRRRPGDRHRGRPGLLVRDRRQGGHRDRRSGPGGAGCRRALTRPDSAVPNVAGICLPGSAWQQRDAHSVPAAKGRSRTAASHV